MYTPGYDMMFSPIIGTPSDYDNGDCLLFTNAFRISDQSISKYLYNKIESKKLNLQNAIK
jgi:hypothetical protein